VASSILTDVKKALNIADADTSFDIDVTMHINSAFSTLTQVGIGPASGFAIVDKTTTWDSFIGTDPRKAPVKTYIYLSVRLIFDPPTTSFVIESYRETMKEILFRLNLDFENDTWEPPVSNCSSILVLDGGVP
jgi:hypothetical protein